MNRTDSKPYLIQRIQDRYIPARPAKGPVDASFGFDYMGSAEFEFGTINKALKAMREYAAAHDPKEIILVKIEHNKNKCYFVGPKSCLQMATDIFIDQLEDTRKFRFKEMTYIKQNYCEPKESWGKCVGWWAVDESINPWAFFVRDEDARAWKKAVFEAAPATK